MSVNICGQGSSLKNASWYEINTDLTTETSEGSIHARNFITTPIPEGEVPGKEALINFGELMIRIKSRLRLGLGSQCQYSTRFLSNPSVSKYGCSVLFR